MIATDLSNAIGALIVPLAAGLICASLIFLLRPMLRRYALARPNARSSHVIPTPQGGGIAVMASIAIVTAIAGSVGGADVDHLVLVVLFAAFCLAGIGLIDDLRPIAVIPRLALQLVAVALLFMTLPSGMRIFELVPVAIERAILIVGMLWFINLVNFMDGLDWMTVVEIVPVTAALALLAFLGEAPAGVLLIALALAGALLGFAPFNRPVARLFLGDVGSLPIGFLTGWCLLELAYRQHLVAALLLPLYYLADATITLFRRFANGERFWDAHRSHFYQRATNNGFSVSQVVANVFVLNLFLAGLAIASVFVRATIFDIAILLLGAFGVATVLVRFSRIQTSHS